MGTGLTIEAHKECGWKRGERLLASQDQNAGSPCHPLTFYAFSWKTLGRKLLVSWPWVTILVLSVNFINVELDVT